MKNIWLLFCLPVSQLFGQGIHFKDIPMDTNYSFRGLSVVDDSVAWVSGVNGRVGKSTNGGINWNFTQVKGFEKSDFRTLYAFDAKTALIANAGSPAYILRTNDGGASWNIAYTNKDSLAFFDGMDFWNDKEGIIYGDSIGGSMLLLRTEDAGLTWQLLPEQSRPLLVPGEASFAASGTGILCYQDQDVAIATGGIQSQLFVSGDKGQHWHPVQTPIVKGKNSTGIFSLAYSAETKCFIIAGGDYLDQSMKVNHVFWKTDTTTWIAPVIPTGGYRECVEFITGKITIAVGPEGSDVSYDAGKNWIPIPDAKSLHVISKARKGKLVVAAGSKRISVVSW